MEITAPECASDPGSLCQWVWDNTGADFLARNSDQVASSTLHIAAIVFYALRGRRLIGPMITGNDAQADPARPLRPAPTGPTGPRAPARHRAPPRRCPPSCR